MHEEFDRQVHALAASGIADVVGVSVGEMEASLLELLPRLEDVPGRVPGAPAGADFVVVPDLSTVDLDDLPPLLRLPGSDRPGILDRNHGPEGLRDYRPLPGLDVPARGAYLLVGVERGEEFCGVRPGDAVVEIERRGRTPLTIAEGIALQLVLPALLEKNKCFMLAGSRRGDRRVPALWISDRAPKLGWCWEGNPHSWLGTASALGRRA